MAKASRKQPVLVTVTTWINGGTLHKVAVDDIADVIANKRGCEVLLHSGRSLHVNETADVVEARINKARKGAA